MNSLIIQILIKHLKNKIKKMFIIEVVGEKIHDFQKKHVKKEIYLQS